eukprot:3933582-Rhodomonas_salina.2
MSATRTCRQLLAAYVTAYECCKYRNRVQERCEACGACRWKPNKAWFEIWCFTRRRAERVHGNTFEHNWSVSK